MLPCPATVLKHIPIVAARSFQGIGKNGHALKSPPAIDSFGEGHYAGGLPGGVNGHGPEGIAENFPE